MSLPFNLTLQNSVELGDSTATASATPGSDIDLTPNGLGLSARGSVTGVSSNVNSYFSTSSEFSVTFAVDVATPFLLNEQVSSANEIDLGLLGVDLVGDGESLIGTQIPGLPKLEAANVPTFQTTGVLAPGTYTLNGGARATAISLRLTPATVPASAFPRQGWQPPRPAR